MTAVSEVQRSLGTGSQSSRVCDGITKDLQAEVNHLIKAALDDMKNNPVVSRAMPLICKHPEKDCFIIPDESRSWIDSLPGPFRIAIINGKLRGGKSFFFTVLIRHMMGHFRSNPNLQNAGKDTEKYRVAFETSDAYESFTKGAVMCSMLHPDGGTIIFVDSEGSNATENNKEYDAKLFSIIFSLAQILMFNHPDGILNSNDTLENMELSISIAKNNAPSSAAMAKALLILCRNSRLSNFDNDPEKRRKYMEDSFKNKRLVDIFQDCFSLVDVAFIASPAESTTNIVDKHFNSFSPGFKDPFNRCFRIITSKLRVSSPALALGDRNIGTGSELLSLLDEMLSAINKGEQIPSLQSAALLVQINAQNDVEKHLTSVLLGSAAQLNLPVLNEYIDKLYQDFLAEAKLVFSTKVVLVVDQELLRSAYDSMCIRFEEQVKEWRNTNKKLSEALAELVLVESFAAFIRGDGESANIPPYVFDPNRDGISSRTSSDAKKHYREVVVASLESALNKKARSRVSKGIVDTILANFIRENIDPHCVLIGKDWDEAKQKHELMKKNELKLNELEKKQRENESAYANLQKELEVKSKLLKDDIEAREAMQRKLEAEAAKLRAEQAALKAEQDRALAC